MKRALVGLIVAAVAALGAFGGMAASPTKTSGLQTFGTGTVTIGADGTSATIVNGAGQFGGVFISPNPQSGKFIGAVRFAFNSTGDSTGGAPRFSIPINTGTSSATNGYAFIDVLGCGYSSGAVDTTLSNCQVFFSGDGVEYANWSTFAADHPSYRIAPGQGHVPFIIADEPGNYAVNSIVL
jgi:hypothetical protein